VSVLLGNGDGTFQPAQTYAVGPNVNGIAVGDFTGTGVLDLVAVSYNYFGTVSVLMGNGDGTFQPAVTYPTGQLPYSVAVGDLTGNGILDLIVPVLNVDQQTTGVSVLLGNGDGTFQAPVTYPAGPGGPAVSVALADFTGDGIPDIAVTQVGYPGSVSVLEGNGDGTFQPPPTSYAVGLDPRLMAVGDFNGDGFPDVAVSNWNNGGDSTVSVLLNAGDGTPAPASAHHTALAALTARPLSAAPLSAPLALPGLQAPGPLTVSGTDTPPQPTQAAPATVTTGLLVNVQAISPSKLPLCWVRDDRDAGFAGWEDLRTDGLLADLTWAGW
jgi:hypothetical protein